MKINIIRNTASQGYLIGKALENEGHEINYFIAHPESLFLTFPSKYNVISRSHKIPFERTFKKKYYQIKYPADLEILISESKPYTKADTRMIWWTGSDIINHPKWKDLPYSQFVATPDLLSISDNFQLLNILVDFKLFSKKNIDPNFIDFNFDQYDYVVGHFPTNPNLKGSKLIIDYLIRLIKQDQKVLLITNNLLSSWEYFGEYKIKYRNYYLVVNAKRENMPSIYSYCNLVIDQAVFNRGLIATTGLEAMSMGIPVACSINPFLLHQDELAEEITNIKLLEDGTIDFDIECATQIKPKKYIQKYHTFDAATRTLKSNNIIP